MADHLTASIPLDSIRRIQLYINTARKSLADIQRETGADYILNGTLYNMRTFAPVCHLKADGAVLCRPAYNVVHKASVSDSDTDGAGKTVVLDAGHDAANLANKSPDGSYYEHEFSLDMAKRIGAHLRRCGVTVVETRPDGAAVSLAERCAIANDIKGLDLFVSLHSNAAGGSGWSSARGWSAYLYGAGGEREQAAQAILDRVRETGTAVRSAPIVYDPSLYVLKHTAAPAVLIEHAFHTNQEDVANLKDSAWRATVAEAEARGITDYLGIPWVAETPQEPVVDVELEQAVDALAAAGIIDSPDRWKALEYTERSVRALLIKMAAKLKC